MYNVWVWVHMCHSTCVKVRGQLLNGSGLVFAISWHPETQTGSRRDCPRSAWPVGVSVGEDPAHCDWHHSLALGLVSGLSKSREGLHSFLPAFAHSWDKVHGVPAGLTSLWFVSTVLQMNTRLLFLHNSSFLGAKSWLRRVAWRLSSLTTYCPHCLPAPPVCPPSFSVVRNLKLRPCRRVRS